MCAVKCCGRLVVIAFILHSAELITTGFNGTAEVLWDLANFAVQSRQNTNYYQNQKYPRPQFGYPSISPQIGPQINPNIGYPQSGLNTHYYQNYYPHATLPPYPQSFMDALYSIAQNDKLHCVPRLLCEVTSGRTSETRKDSFLPFNINMDSLFGLLSSINGADASPLLLFGKAALLGYGSKGNSASCMYAYPQCPRDPDRLVEYLNNHNGGFFRFFGGIQPQNQALYPQYYKPGYPQKYGPAEHYYKPEHLQKYGYIHNSQQYYGNPKLQQRIQTKPSRFISSTKQINSEITFPNHEHTANEVPDKFLFSSIYNTMKPSKYPTRYTENDGSFRQRKGFSFPGFSGGNYLDFQKPLPNHKAVPMSFPDRTGTGELRLDSANVEVHSYPNDVAYFPNNNAISTNQGHFNDLYYKVHKSNSLEENSDLYVYNNGINNVFRFPSSLESKL